VLSRRCSLAKIVFRFVSLKQLSQADLILGSDGKNGGNSQQSAFGRDKEQASVVRKGMLMFPTKTCFNSEKKAGNDKNKKQKKDMKEKE
jgi:hypothetical protein